MSYLSDDTVKALYGVFQDAVEQCYSSILSATALCKQNSKVLAHSLLPQRRAFIKKCIEAVILDPIRREVHIKLDISPFLMKSDDVKTAKKLEVSEFDTSSELVAGAGFEPTTFGL